MPSSAVNIMILYQTNFFELSITDNLSIADIYELRGKIFMPLQFMSAICLFINLVSEPMAREIIVRALCTSKKGSVGPAKLRVKRSATKQFDTKMEQLDKEGSAGNLQALF